MARLEWVDQRLKNWALWHERQASGGLGFATQSSFLKEFDSGRYRTSFVPCDEVEAGVTDQGVAALRLVDEGLFDTVVLIYLKDSGIKGAAKVLHIAESSVKARLVRADHRLGEWFTERKRQQAEARKLRGFTS
jgi:hypothetical protein